LQSRKCRKPRITGTFHDPADTENFCAQLEKKLNELIGNLNQYALDWPVCPGYQRPDPDAPIMYAHSHGIARASQ
jgi:hypothetical protein